MNDTYSLYELQLDFLSSKLTNVIDHLDTLKPSRVKRGLIDGLGSVIKSVTGNLDYSDAVRYDNTIKILQDNELKISEELNNHISVSKEWMVQHSNAIIQLVTNQAKINETLKLILDKDAYKDKSLIKYAKFGQYLTILTENLDAIQNELVRIENIIAFIHSSSSHHSMISTEVLRHMIERLAKIYGRDKILDLELRQYYDIIKPGYYYSGNQIVIIFKIPIFAIESYDLYKLSIAPNKFRQALIPPYPLIATSRKGYVYIEAECPKYNNWYICEDKMNHQLQQRPDCIQNLIINQSLDSTCEIATVFLSRIAMEELDEKHYVISFPNATRIHTLCGREDYSVLNGSYLATVPVNCFLYTSEFTITNLNDHVEGQPLKITKLHYTDSQPEATQFKLNSIDLTNLHDAQYKVMAQTPLQLQPIQSEYLYHTTIPLYIILSSLLALAIFIILRRHKMFQCKMKEQPAGDETYAVPGPSETPKIQSAIFSQLKLQK
uniref:Envelope fusion protein n=1 Tax=Heliothis virescens TaxID=7102 RepID=A0A2A4JNX4_HELVI